MKSPSPTRNNRPHACNKKTRKKMRVPPKHRVELCLRGHRQQKRHSSTSLHREQHSASGVCVCFPLQEEDRPSCHSPHLFTPDKYDTQWNTATAQPENALQETTSERRTKASRPREAVTPSEQTTRKTLRSTELLDPPHPDPPLCKHPSN